MFTFLYDYFLSIFPQGEVWEISGLFCMIRESDTPLWTLENVDMNYVANVYGPKNKSNVHNFLFVSCYVHRTVDNTSYMRTSEMITQERARPSCSLSHNCRVIDSSVHIARKQTKNCAHWVCNFSHKASFHAKNWRSRFFGSIPSINNK